MDHSIISELDHRQDGLVKWYESRKWGTDNGRMFGYLVTESVLHWVLKWGVEGSAVTECLNGQMSNWSKLSCLLWLG